MQVRYSEPLQRGYDGMVDRLFRPFDLGKWFVVGFTCWLATFIEAQGGGSSSFNYPSNWAQDSEGAMLASSSSFSEIPWLGALGVLGCSFLVTAILALILVFFWLGSRGQFMFLDNVIHDRAQVKAPWAQYKRQGNSLFLWIIGFTSVAFLVLGGVGLLAVIGLGLNSVDWVGAPDWGLIAILFAIFLPLVIVAVYVQLFLTHFVVPIMYAEKLTATAAWGRFLPVFRAHSGHFLLYGLFIFVLMIGVVIAVFVAGCLTLCIGFLILIIPYIGTVALLPVYVTKRLLSVEFLHQVMPELGLVSSPPPRIPVPSM